MNNKVLIVGGAGYIGGYMTDYLIGLGYSVTVYDALLYEARYLKQVDFIYGDVRDRDKLSNIVHNFDVIVWLAAIVGDGACAVDQHLTRSINEHSVEWISNEFKGKFIFMSTCSVYGAADDFLTEESQTNPLSIYAETKLAAEHYIIKNSENYLIFRLGTLYGISDTYSRIRLDLVVNALTMKAVLGEDITVFGGQQWRPLLHVKDVAHAVEHGLKHDNVSGLYNLCKNNMIISDIAKKIADTVTKETHIKYVAQQYEDKRNYKVSAKKYEKQGWNPLYEIESGIKDIANVIQENRIKNVKNPIYNNEMYLNECKNGGYTWIK